MRTCRLELKKMNYTYLKIIDENNEYYNNLLNILTNYQNEYNRSIQLLKTSQSQRQYYNILNQVNLNHDYLIQHCQQKLISQFNKNNYKLMNQINITFDLNIDYYEIINFYTLHILPFNLKLKVNNEADKIVAIKFYIKYELIYCEIEYSFTNSLLDLYYSSINYDDKNNKLYLMTNKQDASILIYDINLNTIEKVCSHLLHYIEYYTIDILLIPKKLMTSKNELLQYLIYNLIINLEINDDITCLLVDNMYTAFTSFMHGEQPYHDNQYQSMIKIDLFINQGLQLIKKIDKHAFKNEYTNYTKQVQYIT